MGGETTYGVPVEAQDQSLEVEEAQPLRAVEQYPNPCGRWADIGDFRDGWFAIVWLLTAVAIVALGGQRWATGDYYRSSSGKVTVALEFSDAKRINKTIDATGECFGIKPKLFGDDYGLYARCDRKNLYVGGFDEIFFDMSLCTSTLSGLKNDPHTLVVSRDAVLPMNSSVSTSFGKISVVSSTCELDDGSFASSGASWILPVICAVALLASLVWLLASRAFARQVIIGSNLVAAVILAGFAVFYGVEGVILGSVLFGLLAVITLLFLWCAWSRIPFASLCLEMAAHIVLTYWGTVVVAMGALALTVVFIVCFLFCLSNEEGDLQVNDAVLWLAIVAFYWGGETLMNVVHVTTSGVASDWFFARGGPGTPPYFAHQGQGSATLAAFKRASLWSLGSICFGSLVVAIIRALRLACRLATERAPLVVRCIVLCLMSLLESLVEYFNDYAYVQVAMFGKSYLTAAKDTWALVKNGTAWDALINDALLDRVFFVSIIQIGALSGLVAFFISGKSILWLIVGLIAGIRLSSMVMQQVYSSVLTVFIGFWHLKSVGVMWAPTTVGEYMPSGDMQATMDKKYNTRVQAEGYAEMDQ